MLSGMKSWTGVPQVTGGTRAGTIASGRKLMGWKIVRDLHQERLEDQISGQWRTAPDPVSALVKKIGEEYGEFCEDYHPSELFDLFDVLQELICLMDPDGKFQAEHQDKVRRLGYFTRHVLWHPNPTITWEQLDTAGSLAAPTPRGAPDESEGHVRQKTLPR
jgi:predicted house-cleaning noncanonical NTP pyrophosphatase (MazG superfamily)